MKTVLLVDDSATLRLSLRTELEQSGYKCDTATGGDAALERLKTTKPDIILTDLNMPGMDGITLVKAIRKLPGFRFIPILVVTTESQQEKRNEARAAGATGWLVKPVKRDDLLATLTKILPG